MAVLACIACLTPQALAQSRAPAIAPMVKTLHVAFPVAETGFDPQATSDLYSDHVQRAIFEPLYGFDYLARPYKRVPRTAAALPKIEDGGRTWTIRVRPGIYFADDPAFKRQAPRAHRAPITSIRGSGCSIRACARRSRGTCRARSSAPTR